MLGWRGNFRNKQLRSPGLGTRSQEWMEMFPGGIWDGFREKSAVGLWSSSQGNGHGPKNSGSIWTRLSRDRVGLWTWMVSVCPFQPRYSGIPRDPELHEIQPCPSAVSQEIPKDSQGIPRNSHPPFPPSHTPPQPLPMPTPEFPKLAGLFPRLFPRTPPTATTTSALTRTGRPRAPSSTATTARRAPAASRRGRRRGSRTPAATPSSAPTPAAAPSSRRRPRRPRGRRWG